MKIQFLGTAAAEGIPAIFCNCQICKEARADRRLWRTRSQVMIDDILSVDFPPDAYYHMLEFGLDFPSLKYVVVTHSHMDHFYAHDFCMRGYKYSRHKDDVLSIYGNSEVLDVFKECTRRELKKEVESGYELYEIEPFSEYHIGEYRVLTIPASHCDTEQALLFYIEKDGSGYLHLYDTGPFDVRILDYLKDNGAKASVVSFDCTLVSVKSDKGARHMGLFNDLDIRDALITRHITDESSKYVITHFSHNSFPSAEGLSFLEKEYGVIAAYDGLEIET